MMMSGLGRDVVLEFGRADRVKSGDERGAMSRWRFGGVVAAPDSVS